MNTKTLLVFLSLIAAVSSGCASKKKVEQPVEATVVGATISPVARPVMVESTPLPHYINPQFVEVFMDAYENERGELVKPSEKIVMRRKGRWNMDAARNPERGYIPEDNTVPIPGAEGWTRNIMPGEPMSFAEVAPEATGQPGQTNLRNLHSSSDVRVLGVVNKEQADLARSRLRKGEVLQYDSVIGYFAVPQETLYNTPVDVPGLREDIRIVPESNKPEATQPPPAERSQDDSVR